MQVIRSFRHEGELLMVRETCVQGVSHGRTGESRQGKGREGKKIILRVMVNFARLKGREQSSEDLR